MSIKNILAFITYFADVEFAYKILEKLSLRAPFGNEEPRRQRYIQK